jgi:hypothetical protein
MLNSALNFAIGFFGYPLENKYQQSITIEADGVRTHSSFLNMYRIAPFSSTTRLPLMKREHRQPSDPLPLTLAYLQMRQRENGQKV